jgi:hypothetical protein
MASYWYGDQGAQYPYQYGYEGGTGGNTQGGGAETGQLGELRDMLKLTFSSRTRMGMAATTSAERHAVIS